MERQAQLWRRQVRMGAQTLEFEVGRIARQAGGAVLLTCGRCVVLATAVAAPEASGGATFFPLTVIYREKLAAAGRIPGGFLRREARPTDEETLISRVIDRSIRPFFPPGFACETQVLATVFSHDPEVDPAVLAITAASAALTISDVPWGPPIAAVRVARIDGEPRILAPASERGRADLDLVVALSREGLVMVEGSAREVSEEVLLGALDEALAAAVPLLEIQDEMRAALGKEKRGFQAAPVDEALQRFAQEYLAGRIEGVYTAGDKQARHARMDQLITETDAAWVARQPDPTAAPPGARETAEKVMRELIRARALEGQRLDGRGPEDVRPISGEAGWLPGPHGSAVFTRGETQALVTCTLGTSQDEQLIESLAGVRKESFLLHYTFPPYSVGEVRPLRGPGRREIGHGALARRALVPLLPDPEAFPFTIRIDAEISSSNGSSSMATVSGSTLALFDAGVPLRRPVAGVAMGLIAAGERSAVLTDILGDEDHLGDMDFKVAGTAEGVTAVQLDNKIGSLPRAVLAQALEQARRGRLHILGEMARICPGPRTALRPHVPQVRFVRIRPARIRDLIGPGGRNIQGIEAETGAKLDVGDDGRVRVFGYAGTRLEEAERRVRYLTGEPRVGAIYRGRVTGITDFGCFVELFYGIEGLVHISELGEGRVDHPASVTALGEELLVKVLGTNEEGKIQLSHRAAKHAGAGEIEG